MVKKALSAHGYGNTSLVATSLCCDEVNRPLEQTIASAFGSYFAMGGLAGFPFGGVTSFGAMAHHIPDGGSCLVIYGPHVGVDADGKVGTVGRRGREKGGACCGSAVAACGYVNNVMDGKIKPGGPPTGPLDAQQTFVGNMLLPHGERLQAAANPMAELPYAMFDAQDDLMQQIIAKGCSQVHSGGKIALLGGIQINTPDGVSDYFLPLRFDLLNNSGELMDKFVDIPCRVSLEYGVEMNATVRYYIGRNETLTLSFLFQQGTIGKIASSFPRAVTNSDLIDKVSGILSSYGYGKNTLVATSLCCDEVNRPLETALVNAFGNHFNLGGLAGFPFAGVTGFGAMAHHIPDGGSCLIIYGPHVGIDANGKVGTVDRRGRQKGGSCCGSGVAAAIYVNSVRKGAVEASAPTDPLDAQQAYVGQMLLPYGERLEKAEEPMVELPYALFDAQDKLMMEIIAQGATEVSGRGGKIALLGGIQINTPDGLSDYFLPLKFDLYNTKGHVIDDLLWESKNSGK